MSRIWIATCVLVAVVLPAIHAAAEGVDSDQDGVIDDADNCRDVPNAGQEDFDRDGYGDVCDNCQDVPNAGQEDSDADGYGNVCDGDLNNDLIVGAADFSMFAQCMNMPGEGARSGCFIADFNSDHKVNSMDFTLLEAMYGLPPGPSGTAM